MLKTTDLIALRSRPQPLLRRDEAAACIRSALQKDRRRKQNAKFVVFLHVLLQYLHVATPSKVLDVKRVIRDSIQRNRKFESGTSPLSPFLLRRIKDEVGPVHWELASGLFREFMEAKKLQHQQQRIREWAILLNKKNPLYSGSLEESITNIAA